MINITLRLDLSFHFDLNQFHIFENELRDEAMIGLGTADHKKKTLHKF